MVWMWSYEYISQITGKDAGKNRGDVFQVTSSTEFVGLRWSRHFLLFRSPWQQCALSSAVTQLTRWALKIGDDFFELFVSSKLPFFGGKFTRIMVVAGVRDRVPKVNLCHYGKRGQSWGRSQEVLWDASRPTYPSSITLQCLRLI